MGFSQGYNLFAGGGELLAGLLLFWRRTTTLGALLAMAVMANVVAMNFFFDIPVKLFSSHLLLMAAGLAALDRHRLVNLLVLGRSAEALSLTPHFTQTRARTIGYVFKLAFLAALLIPSVQMQIERLKTRGDNRLKPPLYGLYEIESSTGDGEHWRHLVVETPGFATVRSMDGTLKRFSFELDQEAATFTLTTRGNSPVATHWRYQEPDEETLVIEGEMAGQPITMLGRRKTPEDFLLVNRGFRWINEFPFNR